MRQLAPQPSTRYKTFHWAFPTQASFPVTTKVEVNTTGHLPGDPVVSAQAKIRWHTVWEGADAFESPFMAWPAGVSCN